MPKLVTTDINSESGFTSDLNANFALVEVAFENTLSRDGTSPNAMSGNLDMNSKRILNLPSPNGLSEPLRLQDADTLGIVTIGVGTIPNPAAATVGHVLTANGTILPSWSVIPPAPLGLASLVDPNADRILFWDDSFGGTQFLTASTGLLLSGTTLTVNMLGLQSLSAPGADRVYCYDQTTTDARFFTLTAPLQFNGTTIELDPTPSLIPTVDTVNDKVLILDATDNTWKYCAPTALSGVAAGTTEIKYTTADVTITADATPNLDASLQGFTLLANAAYAVEGCIDTSQTNVTGEFRCKFTTSVAPVKSRVSYDYCDYSGGVTPAETHLGSSEDMLSERIWSNQDNGGTTESIIVKFVGHITAGGSNGTLDFNWAQGAAAGDTTVYRGSWIRLTKLSA